MMTVPLTRRTREQTMSVRPVFAWSSQKTRKFLSTTLDSFTEPKTSKFKIETEKMEKEGSKDNKDSLQTISSKTKKKNSEKRFRRKRGKGIVHCFGKRKNLKNVRTTGTTPICTNISGPVKQTKSGAKELLSMPIVLLQNIPLKNSTGSPICQTPMMKEEVVSPENREQPVINDETAESPFAVITPADLRVIRAELKNVRESGNSLNFIRFAPMTVATITSCLMD